MIYITDSLIQSLFSFSTLTTRDHLCSYERPSVLIWRDNLCPIHFSRFFEPVFRAALILLSRVSPVSFLLFSNILLCVCISIFCRCFQVRHLDQGFCFYSCPPPATRQRGETVRAYLGGFKRWRRWPSFNHFCHLHVNPFQFALCLHCLLNEANCPSLSGLRTVAIFTVLLQRGFLVGS